MFAEALHHTIIVLQKMNTQSMMGHFMKAVRIMMVAAMASFLGATAAAECDKKAPAAIFMFGDGVLDVGNNNYLPDSAQADYPYYGIDFPDSKPTGRFSNGYNMADFIAKVMGFKMSPPAYLSLTSSPIKMDAGFTGVNYASANAGIWYNIMDDATIPFQYQLDNFNATMSQMKDNLGRGHHDKLSKLLKESFFLISIGSMDLESYIWRPLKFHRRPPFRSVQDLLSSFGDAIAAMHTMGARKFGIINIPPIGCRPWVRRLLNDGGKCDDVMNMIAKDFNNGLKPVLDGLGSQLHGLRYSIADFYGFSNATFTKPQAYGFVNMTSPCCVDSCSVPDPHSSSGDEDQPCKNRAQYWFWDQNYLTQQAARVASDAFYDGPAGHFKQLTHGKLK